MSRSSSSDEYCDIQRSKRRRKVNIKFRNSGSEGVTTSKTGLCTTDPRLIKRSTQLDNSGISTHVSEEYVAAVLSPQNNISKPIMSFSTENPFSKASATHPTPTPTPDPTAPPAWAVGIIEDLKTIKLSISKIDRIETAVNKISNKMSEMETNFKSLEAKVTDCESSCQFISEECQNQKDELTYTKNEMKKLRKSCNQMEEQLKQQQNQKESMNEKLVDLEARSMRENLIFYGLTEQDDELCDQLVKELIQSKLHINTTNMTIDRAHRLGSANARKPRPIVVKFHRYDDREKIRQQANSADVKTQLKAAGQGVGIQWPQQLREARKALYPIMKEEESRGHRTRIAGNKLFINNVLKKKFIDGKVCDVNPDSTEQS